MRDPQEENPIDIVNSPVVGEFSVRLWVNRSFLTAGMDLTTGTTLKAFLPKVPKGDALAKGFGNHVLTDIPGEEASGWVSFWFVKPKTTEEMAVPFREKADLEEGVDWPPVLTGLSWYSIPRYQEPGGGDTYVERINWEPVFKRFDGLTQVVTREFFAPTKFEIELPLQMRPSGFIFDYVLGKFELERCLHSLLVFSFSTGSSDWFYPLLNSDLTVPATNVTDWPAEVVIADNQREVAGGYLRTQKVAMNPNLP